MADEWFYARNGEKHGPLTSADLKQSARDGRLLPTDLIWKKGMQQWAAAGRVRDLFPPVSTEAPPLPQPGTATSTRTVADSLASKAKSAARKTALAAEKAKLLTASLPAAYVQLGNFFYEHREQAAGLESHLAALDDMAEQIKANATQTSDSPANTIAEKAKAVAQKGVQFAIAKKLALQQTERLRQLGKAAFETLALDAAPTPVVTGIQQHLDRVMAIDAELGSLPASLPTIKKWLFRGAAVAAALAGLVISGSVVSSFTGSRDGAKWMLEMKRQAEESKQRIDALARKGDSEWDAGNKQDAVATYIELMELCDDVLDSDVFEGRKPANARAAVRAIDSLVASGNTEAAKKLILIAHKRELTLNYSNAESNALAVATLREKEARDKEARREWAARSPPVGGSFPANGGGFGASADSGDFFGGSGSNAFKPDGANPFDPGSQPAAPQQSDDAAYREGYNLVTSRLRQVIDAPQVMKKHLMTNLQRDVEVQGRGKPNAFHKGAADAMREGALAVSRGEKP